MRSQSHSRASLPAPVCRKTDSHCAAASGSASDSCSCRSDELPACCTLPALHTHLRTQLHETASHSQCKPWSEAPVCDKEASASGISRGRRGIALVHPACTHLQVEHLDGPGLMKLRRHLHGRVAITQLELRWHAPHLCVGGGGGGGGVDARSTKPLGSGERLLAPRTSVTRFESSSTGKASSAVSGSSSRWLISASGAHEATAKRACARAERSIVGVREAPKNGLCFLLVFSGRCGWLAGLQ